MSGRRFLILFVGLHSGVPSAGTAADGPGRSAMGAIGADSANTRSEPDESAGPWCPVGPQHWWASADYTFGWIRGATSPPLLSARPVGGGPSTVLFPDGSLNEDGRSGFQLRGGLWLDDFAAFGIEAGALYLGKSEDRARVGDTPGQAIGRPFFNALLGAPDIELVSVPGALSGQAVAVAAASEFCGADLAFRKVLCSDCRGRLDCLIGYRFLSYDDSIRVTEDLHPNVSPFPPGSQIGVADGFTATNRFHGLLLGLAGEYRIDGWFVEGRAGVSMGRTYRTATVAGATSLDIPPAAPVVLPGGFLALSTNSSNFSTSDWTVVSEAMVRVGYQVTDRLRAYVGYSALYWPNVYRAAGQIDSVVNPGLLPPPIVPPGGPVHPLFPDRKSALWVHAALVGLEWRY
jgi:Putative beta barrel porin-7 (BBP7)